MVDACYLCRRTQAELDRVNEEVRQRVYLTYFSNARGQLDDQRVALTFLQRLKDEESGDPHFRINAAQVFADPAAYQKLMPWIDTLMAISRAHSRPPNEQRTIGQLVEELLAEERRLAYEVEEGLNELRAGFPPGGKVPLALESVMVRLPVPWSVERAPVPWKSSRPDELEPLRREPGETQASVEVPLHICTACRKLTTRP
jgi:hypothetical protein